MAAKHTLTALNGVYVVSGELVGVDDWVNALSDDWCRARNAEPCSSRVGDSSSDGESFKGRAEHVVREKPR